MGVDRGRQPDDLHLQVRGRRARAAPHAGEPGQPRPASTPSPSRSPTSTPRSPSSTARWSGPATRSSRGSTRRGTWYRYRPFYDPEGNMLYVTEPHKTGTLAGGGVGAGSRSGPTAGSRPRRRHHRRRRAAWAAPTPRCWRRAAPASWSCDLDRDLVEETAAASWRAPAARPWAWPPTSARGPAPRPSCSTAVAAFGASTCSSTTPAACTPAPAWRTPTTTTGARSSPSTSTGRCT